MTLAEVYEWHYGYVALDQWPEPGRKNAKRNNWSWDVWDGT